MATTAEIQTAYKALYRVDLNPTVASAIAASGISLDAYIAQQMPQVATTTQASVAIAAFVTGLTPTSAKLDALTADANKQVASYTAMGSANPQLGAFEAFGRAFATDSETGVTFNTKYGALSNTDFINVVYAQVYGSQPNAAQLASLQGQIDYFTKLYAANNVPNGAIAAKGAVLGQIVGYAFTSAAAANSTLDNQVQSFLTSAANGVTTGYGAALPPASGTGNPGAILTLTIAADVVDPTATLLQFKSTAGDDTIRALDPGTLNSTDVINGGAGVDSLVITGGFLAGTAPVLNSVEKIVFAAANNSLDLSSATGVDTIESNVGANAVTNAALTTIYSIGGTGDLTVGFKDASGTNDTVNVTANAATAGKLTSVGIENYNVKTAGAVASVLALSDVNIKTVTVTGSQNLTLDLTAANNDALKTVNASGLTGGLTFNETVKAVTITGGSGADNITLANVTPTETVTVSTGAGADTINVAAVTGKAVITGGAGGDTITLQAGGAGTATLVYTAATDSVYTNFDAVTAFTTAEDKLDFKGLGLTGKTTTVAAGTTTNVTIGQFAGGVADFFKVGGSTLAVATFAEGGSTYVFADTNNNGNFDAGSDLVVKLTGTAAVAVGDFVFA